MSIHPTLKQTLWKRWKRGSAVLWGVIGIVQMGVLFVSLPAGLVALVLDGMGAPKALKVIVTPILN